MFITLKKLISMGGSNFGSLNIIASEGEYSIIYFNSTPGIILSQYTTVGKIKILKK